MHSPVRRPQSIVIALVVAAAFALSACGGAASTPVTQEGAESTACANLTALGDSVRAFVALEASSASVEDVQAARDDIAEAWTAVKDSVADISDADEAAMEAAWASVESAVDAIPTDQPIAAMLDGVKAAVAEVQTAFDEIRNGVDCQ